MESIQENGSEENNRNYLKNETSSSQSDQEATTCNANYDISSNTDRNNTDEEEKANSNLGCDNNIKMSTEDLTTQNSDVAPGEIVSFKIVYNKVKYDITSDLDHTIEHLKIDLEKLLGVPRNLQKVMYKGLAKDEQTLRSFGIVSGAKVMIVGSKLDDILAVSGTSKENTVQEEKSTPKEPLSKQKIHRKVLDKGVPDDAMPGILNIKEPLPPRPLSGMLNKNGGKVRLTFKLEQDQLWLGTRERTEKLPMNSIKNVVSEPIEGFEHYHIMGLQLGPTEASRYWIYWVPAQYADAIKDAILGKWQYF